MAANRRVSVIVPALNESARIGALVASLRAGGFDEVIVADGGSDDDTAALAMHAGALLARAPRGRGLQMHAGAGHARGEVLFFLHADSDVPPGARAAILAALERPGVVAGSFALAFDERHWFLDALAGLSRINHALTTYGDQGLFMARDVYDAIGGFKPMPILEDLEIQHRLRRRGRFIKLRQCLRTSARRFLQDGIVRRQCANVAIVACYLAGESPEELARRYRY